MKPYTLILCILLSLSLSAKDVLKVTELHDVCLNKDAESALIMLVSKVNFVDFSGYYLDRYSHEIGRYELKITVPTSLDASVRIWHSEYDYIEMPLLVDGKPLKRGRVYEATLTVEAKQEGESARSDNRVSVSSVSCHVQGRNVVGNVPRPSCRCQEQGHVVVAIWVDRYGNVKNAVAGSEGTTSNDKTLWAAARNAALNTHFNVSADAPSMQKGSITYVFGQE